MQKFKFDLTRFLDLKSAEIILKLFQIEPEMESYLFEPIKTDINKRTFTFLMMTDDLIEYRIIPHLIKIFSDYDVDIMKYRFTSTLTLGDDDKNLTLIEFKIIQAIN